MASKLPTALCIDRDCGCNDFLDILFENEVLWEYPSLGIPYSYLVEYGEDIPWDSIPPPPSPNIEVPELDEEKVEEELKSLEKEPDVKQAEKLDEKSLTLPQQFIKQQAFVTNRREEFLKQGAKEIPEEKLPLDLLKLNFFQESKDDEGRFPEGDPLSRDATKDLEEEQHQEMVAEQEKQKALGDKKHEVTYNLKDFPLAEPELVNQLCEAHLVFFNLLSKLQETHTPTDFTTAYHIQDRIAYLIDNQTLLYKTLTKQLIKYLERINTKLKKYYDEITLKQEDLRKINAQISRFNEYDRQTQTRINQAEAETKAYREDVKSYEAHIEGITASKEEEGEKPKQLVH
ncbi:hypothetical protein MHLP_00210 [Candidatus Mycoplasma haematolamae str. Purdue]|uniref:Uncharacterized protein n=1 Tax=Mycoplasma haematolamae (strain Purdue) TaxID=1212765 RepID=I7C550_MYCHA|nr:hypothetical protein [Candidatus Mycoplasma haematolamae]AFO51622.1 hypothetical protein MHLP_00210 [Candidatus Mycoplasma haematolamae str. Purdue]